MNIRIPRVSLETTQCEGVVLMGIYSVAVHTDASARARARTRCACLAFALLGVWWQDPPACCSDRGPREPAGPVTVVGGALLLLLSQVLEAMQVPCSCGGGAFPAL